MTTKSIHSICNTFDLTAGVLQLDTHRATFIGRVITLANSGFPSEIKRNGPSFSMLDQDNLLIKVHGKEVFSVHDHAWFKEGETPKLVSRLRFFLRPDIGEDKPTLLTTILFDRLGNVSLDKKQFYGVISLTDQIEFNDTVSSAIINVLKAVHGKLEIIEC